MYRRTIEEKLNALKKQFPVIAVFGPRQSGKTTLTRKVFSSYRYVNLESFEEQERANEDPKKFLERFMDDEGIILDEIQKAPKLLSYIQIVVDEDKRPGKIHHYRIAKYLTQSTCQSNTRRPRGTIDPPSPLHLRVK